jgi:anti-sigma regulatory factor (Ser/Thr protein kinase)
MADELTLMIKNSMGEISPAIEAVARWISDRNLSPRIDYLPSLAIEELVTNCIKYAYPAGEEHVISIELRLVDRTLALSVTDDGRPFNPLEAPAPNLDLPPEERPIGGLGIHLLRQLADGMDYVRMNYQNRVTLWMQCR